MRKCWLTTICFASGASLWAHSVIYQSPSGTLVDSSEIDNIQTPFAMSKLFNNGDATITVMHFPGEHCLVTASIVPEFFDPLVAISVNGITKPNDQGVLAATGLDVAFRIHVLREPRNNTAESVILSGSWRANGLTDLGPPDGTCNGHGGIYAKVTVYAMPSATLPKVSSAQQPNAVPTGDPVSTATGEITALAVDLSLGGPLPLRFARYYGSMLNTSSPGSALGPNWMHNFDHTLAVSGSVATVFLFPGKAIRFQSAGSRWQIASVEQYNYQLVSVGTGYQFLDLTTNLIYDFAADGTLKAIEDRNGNMLSVTQGPSGPVSVSDGLGRTLTFQYTGSNLSSVQDQTGRRISFAYSSGNLVRVTDALGQIRKLNCATGAQDGLLASMVQPAGNTPWSQAFDGSGRVVHQTDSVGNITSISFDPTGTGSRQATDPLGRMTAYSYDSSGNLTQYTDALGSPRTFEYDNMSRLKTRTDTLGNRTSLTYDGASGYITSITDPLGEVVTYTYTSQVQGAFTFYNLTKATPPDGNSFSFAYDSAGRPTSRTDRAGKMTTYTYNSRGQMLTETNPAGGVVTMTYNADGTMASIKSPAGDVITFGYDNLKPVIQVKFPDNTTRLLAYDALDRAISTTDESGKVTTVTFDANGNLISARNPLAQTETASYDTDDLMSASADPLGGKTQFQYDAVGSLSTGTDASGITMQYGYDALDRLTSATDPMGNSPHFAYDSESRISKVSDALGNVTTLTHDAVGQLTRVTTPLGENYDRTLDSMGRVTSVTNPLAQVTTFSHDARGLLIAVNQPQGMTTSYTYDEQGLPSAIQDPRRNTWSMKHDNLGRLLSRTDPLGRTSSLTYDARNRVSGSTSPLGSVKFAYDPSGNLTGAQYSDGTAKTFAYDDANRLIAATGVTLAYDAAGRMVGSNGLAIARDPAGRIISITYAPGKVVNYTYDQRGLPAQVTDWTGASISISFDAAGRLVSLARPNGVNTLLGYDANSKIASISEQSADQTLVAIALQRDAAGRIVSADRTGLPSPEIAPGTLPLSYDAANQISSATYDGNGRMVEGLGLTYTWNLASELKTYSGLNGSASFTYDAFGLRTSVAANGTTQNYVLNYATGLPTIATVRSGGADQRYYIYEPGGHLLYAMEAGDDSHHYYHFDNEGSTTLLTDDNGTVTDSYAYTPYGEVVASSGTTVNPFTWLGDLGIMQEGTTGLYYMRQRYYDSTTARFLSPDPLKQPQPDGVNPYVYAMADPLTNVDPSGLKNQAAAVAVGPVSGFLHMVADYLQESASVKNAEAEAAYAEYVTLGSKRYQHLLNMGRSRYQYGWMHDVENPEWWVKGMTEEEYMKQWNREVITPEMNTLTIEERLALNEGERVAEEAAQASSWLSRRAAILKGIGAAITVIAGAIEMGSAIYDDVKQKVGADLIVADALGYVVSTVAQVYEPRLGFVDLFSGGGITTSYHNAAEMNIILPKCVLGRMTSQEADAVKTMSSRLPAGKGLIWLGEKAADSGVGEFLTDVFGEAFFAGPRLRLR
jgi:RHS repeat-associated protein